MTMKRRDFITLVGAAAAWPLAAQAQQRALPVIGLLSGVSLESYADRIAAFRLGLRDAGFVEGQNVIIEYRAADGHAERQAALAADLVRRQVAVIVAIGASNNAAAEATSTIPIVFAAGGDPIVGGFVKSLSRPEGNVTGVSFFSNTLGAKRLGLLHELVPRAASVGFLHNSRLEGPLQTTADSNDILAAGRAVGVQMVLLDAGSEQEIDAAFDTIAQQRLGALVVQNDAYLNTRKDQIAALAVRHAIPTVFAYREHVAAGGLMSYGADVNEMYRVAGVYTARILKGEKPGDLPVQLPTKFEFVINLKTAKTLGIDVPVSMQLLADEVVE
jgi:putative tryptophan/tyrosine transport system substrate-binding protein